MSSVERHALVWLNDAGWSAAIAAARPEHQAALGQWQREDWPAVARRLDADAAPDEVCLGLPLPPDAHGTKVRIALRTRTAHIARTSDAIELKSALPAAGAWREHLATLCDEAPGLRVFGSLAMQALTGLRYVSPASDIDSWIDVIDQQTWLAGDAVKAYVGDGPLITDDRPRPEYFLLRRWLGID